MARSRNIKPGFFLNDQLAEVDPLGRLLFAGLWCIADREGRLEDRPKRIKAETLPYDDCDVHELLNQLAKRGFIIRYEVAGEPYIQIVNFEKHQNPHRNERASEIPPPEFSEPVSGNSDTSTIQVPECSETGIVKGPKQDAGELGVNPDLEVVLGSSGTSTIQVPDKHSTNRADSLNLIPVFGSIRMAKMAV